MLHACSRYFIRANVWKPISALEESIEGFRYDICHDHNFDILTIGYFGPGYRARMYEYEENEVVGLLGERINMIPKGEITLSKNRVFLYRAKKDIHIQLPPESLSISLNFIPRNRRILEPQFQLDEDRRAICRYIHSSGSELIVRMVGLLGDARSVDALDRIRTTHVSVHVRALAAVSQVMLAPDEEDRVRQWLSDPGRLVERSIFEEEIRYPGACLRPYVAA